MNQAAVNPYTADKESLAFPRLTREQVERLTPVGHCRLCSDGDVLFAVNERHFSFFVAIHGKIDIIAPGQNDDGGDLLITTHEPGEFTGDVSMINGQPAIVSAICNGPTDVIEIKGDDLRRVVAEQSDLGDIILRAFLMRREMIKDRGYRGSRLIGSRWSRDTFRLRDFLARNQAVFTWTDPDEDEHIETTLQHFGVQPEDMPVVICPDGTLMKNPPNTKLADCLGLRATIDREAFDLVVVGAGPGGLAAAVYGASEGLKTLVVEGSAPGGQASTSSKIENYLGFPLGLPGADLARRAVVQAQKFGAIISSPRSATGLGCDGHYKHVHFDSGETVMARSVVIATGAEYRRLDAEGCEQFEGSGVYYGATHTEAGVCRDARVIVVGGGNSAGQAAVFLAGFAQHVHLCIRRDSLDDTMSRYLINRIEQSPNITLMPRTRITAFQGRYKLDAVTMRTDDKPPVRLEVGAVFIMIGAAPRTGWLNGCVGLDDRGFVVTGDAARRHADYGKHGDPTRDPYYLESTTHGVFAVGDVRSGSIKRVASAVGEGSMAVKYIHEHLST